jgi:hypothetical protein
MKRLILTYGSIAGFIIIVTNTISLEYGRGQAWLGFLVMFIAFSTIFVAIKQYRDETLGGVISFTTALLVGLGISAVAGVVYVAIWEVYLAATDYVFIKDYANSIVEAQKLDGASEAELERLTSEAERFRVQYSNLLFRLPMTFLEIFPVGLLVSLGSAGVLRNHRSVG